MKKSRLFSSASTRGFRQILRLLREEGIVSVTDRIRRVAASRIAPGRAISPVRQADVLAVDLEAPFLPTVPALAAGDPVLLNWVMTPPSPGSGGHTTIFRMMRYLEAHGYRSQVYFYDVYNSDLAHFEQIVKSYYGFPGPVGNVDHGMRDAHITFATAWTTAYPVFNSRSAGKRFYFVQDFEPFFYPVGGTSALAELTYRMQFQGLIIGESFAHKLRNEFGMVVDSYQFGCDVSQYLRNPDSQRKGVVFYARKENARRGLELGLMALELFAKQHPKIEIHIYGDKLGKQRFPFFDHGHISPEQLNKVYNICFAGLSLSFTNVSLVPFELLAAGCIPVVNDTPYARKDLANPHVLFASAYPQALAAQLGKIVNAPDFAARSEAAAASVQGVSWDDVGASVDAILRRSLQNREQ